jgi:hypothetical protein
LNEDYVNLTVGHKNGLTFAIPFAFRSPRVADGRVQALGREASQLESRLHCRVGAHGVPFAVCADALADDGLLAEVLAPAP